MSTSATPEVQSSLAQWWYGNDEDTLFVASARTLSKLGLGAVFGGAAWTLIKKVIDNRNDPSGRKRVVKAKKLASMIQQKEAVSASDKLGISDTSAQEYKL